MKLDFLSFTHRIVVPAFLCAVLLNPARAEEDLVLQIGDPYDQIVAQLGAPSGNIKAGQRQVLTYPDGILEFHDRCLSKMSPDFLKKANVRRKQMAFEKEQAKKGLVPYADQWVTPQEKLQKDETLRKIKTMTQTGLLTYQIHVKFFNQTSNYFSGPLRTKAYRDAVKDKTYPMTPEQCVSYAPDEQTATVYVPPDYNGHTAFGVCVDIRPADSGGIPYGYAAIANTYHLIWISPDKASNTVKPFRRWALALDSLATIKNDFCVDEQRVFVNGFSGGGLTAFGLLMLYPEFFKGAICHSQSVNLMGMIVPGNQLRLSHFGYLSQDDFRHVAAMGKKWVFISGPGDPNYEQITAVLPKWKELNFNVWFIDVPEMGHTDAPPHAFETALNWLEGKKTVN